MTQDAGASAPGNSNAGYQRAMAAYQSGDLSAARTMGEAALQASPQSADLLHLLSAIHLDAGDAAQGLNYAEQAREAAPESLAVQNGYAIALHRNGRSAEARSFLNALCETASEAPEPLINLAMVELDLGAWTDALAAADAALTLAPDNAAALSNKASVLQRLGRAEEAAALLLAAHERQPDNATVLRNLLSVVHYSPAFDRHAIYRLTQAYWQALPQVQVMPQTHAPAARQKDSSKRLHIGFLSPDFRAHAVAQFLMPVLRHLDRARFKVTLYANQTIEDHVTGALKSAVDGWCPIAHLSDADAAAQITADHVHLLIDLAGHTDGNRLGVMRLKPAPVQAAWIGYIATTGLPEIDYVIADSHVVPPEHDAVFAERVFRLPRCYLCYDVPSERRPVAAPPAARNGVITFGSFNNPVKMSSASVAAWSKILNAVPGSRLLLKAPQLSNPMLRASVLAFCADHGIAEDRVVVRGQTSYQDYLATFNDVDLVLDCFPYNGATTTCDALWMGAPVLTVAGDQWAARFGAMVMHTVGLPQLIAADVDAYTQRAIELAAHPDELAGLRMTLRSVLESSPLCNAAAFARDVEKMFVELCAGA